MTGSRQGELFGLTWPDVDLFAGTPTGRRSLARSLDGWEFAKPKTARSRPWSRGLPVKRWVVNFEPVAFFVHWHAAIESESAGPAPTPPRSVRAGGGIRCAARSGQAPTAVDGEELSDG